MGPGVFVALGLLVEVTFRRPGLPYRCSVIGQDFKLH